MRCPYCNQEHLDGAKFCNVTGKSLQYSGSNIQQTQPQYAAKKPNQLFTIISAFIGVAFLVIALLFSQGELSFGDLLSNQSTLEDVTTLINTDQPGLTGDEKDSNEESEMTGGDETDLPVTQAPSESTVLPTEVPTETTAPEETPVILNGMSLISGGTFNMGASDDEMRWHLQSCNYYASCNIVDYADMQPMHTVRISPFYMDVHEVTNAEYWKCVDAGVCSQPSQTKIAKFLDDNYFSNRNNADYPVVGVDWDDAVTYCEWNGNKRLPTEAEWEFAASDGKHWFFPWLETPTDLSARSVFGGYSQLSNFCDKDCPMKTWRDETLDDGWAGPAPVMSFPVGFFGLYDMSGNVSEWIQDKYSDDYYARSSFENPVNQSGEYRMTRGGGWNNGIYHSSSLFRMGQDANDPAAYIGFRCVKDAD